MSERKGPMTWMPTGNPEGVAPSVGSPREAGPIRRRRTTPSRLGGGPPCLDVEHPVGDRAVGVVRECGVGMTGARTQSSRWNSVAHAARWRWRSASARAHLRYRLASARPETSIGSSPGIDSSSVKAAKSSSDSPAPMIGRTSSCQHRNPSASGTGRARRRPHSGVGERPANPSRLARTSGAGRRSLPSANTVAPVRRSRSRWRVLGRAGAATRGVFGTGPATTPRARRRSSRLRARGPLQLMSVSTRFPGGPGMWPRLGTTSHEGFNP